MFFGLRGQLERKQVPVLPSLEGPEIPIELVGFTLRTQPLFYDAGFRRIFQIEHQYLIVTSFLPCFWYKPGTIQCLPCHCVHPPVNGIRYGAI
jgi:hypothetical protein